MSSKRFGTPAKATRVSVSATVVALVAAIASAGVGLGVFGANVEGVLIAATTDFVALVGLIANAVHTGKVNPSGIATAVTAFLGQVAVLAADFGLVESATASHYIAIASAVVLAGAQLAHALLSRQVP